jgi:indole-3-glycerol phosphate synthase
VPTYLDRIGAWHRDAASRDRRDLTELAVEACLASPPRGFVEALRSSGSGANGGEAIAIVAEIKRRSPSKGDIAPELDAAEVARDYARGGASCLSVLTDGPHFGGSRQDLEAARAAVALPVLRKDFTVSTADLYDARIMGADAVLLIVALLSQHELVELFALARELGLAPLVEVHDEAELESALELGAGLIGVNQRDLHTFELDTERARRLAAHIPGGVVKVAESGVDSAGEVAALAEAGFDAVLVGESLLRSRDRTAAVAGLLGRTVPCG